jgi:phospholipase/carboxylesterase
MSYRLEEHDDAVMLLPEQPASACVIWLHGLGADGRDFVPIVPELRLPRALQVRFVFPHAPVRAVTINNGMRMRAWYDILELSLGRAEDAIGIRDSAARVEAMIARETAAGIAARRIVLAGFSQGGAIALQAGLRHGEALAGVLALSTYLPLQSSLAAEASAANRATPILMCHGRFDPLLPVQLGQLSRDALRALGYEVQWHEYPMQHQVCAEEIADVAAWLGGVLGRA